MDANGTRFHLLLGESDWSRCASGTATLREMFDAKPRRCSQQPAGFEWDSERHEVGLRSCLFEFPAAAVDRRPVPSDRRGAARDTFGSFYWIDESARQIRVISSSTGVSSRFWPVAVDRGEDTREKRGEFAPSRRVGPSPSVGLGGLAVTDDHYLVAGTLDPKGLLIFDLHAGGPPTELCWPAAVPFAPFDMAARPGGGVWILDRENHCYWALDRHFNVVADGQRQVTLVPESRDDFQPRGGRIHATPARRFPESIALTLASPVSASDPVSIEALPDGTVLILDRNVEAHVSLIHQYRFDEPIDALSLEEEGLLGHEFALVPDPASGEGAIGRLYVVGDDGNQARAFRLSRQDGRLRLEFLREYLPIRLFGGKALVAGGAQIFYDLGDSWIPLVEQRQPRFVREATLATPVLNGREPDCVWHRLMLDACIPPGTRVSVESRAANDARDLDTIPWMQEPPPYLRSASEQPFAQVPEAAPRDDVPQALIRPVPTPSSGEGKGTWELLFQQARGQYLQLRLTFAGSRRTTPRIRALRAYYPRFSYLEHYLPGVYRDDEQSASFLDRFLANLEGFYTAIEDRIAAVQMLFDVRSAPPDTLEWLARWFDVAVDPAWTDAKRRLFIRHAMDLFQYRGTMRGLVAAARLALEPCADERLFETAPGCTRTSGIRIVEKYRTRRTPGVVLGDPTEVTGPRRVTLTGLWRPEQGGLALGKRYTDYLRGGAAPEGELKPFPITAPEPAAAEAIWREFATAALGFVPSASSADRSAWRAFLARRYQRVSALNSTYKLSRPLSGFDGVELPAELPADGPALQDWYQFESVVLPMRRTAHRFTVLLPVTTAGRSASDQRAAVDLMRRVVDLEKPAHTVFDVKFYWGLFRLGEARLGEDTLIDRGGRAPDLMTPMTLGQGHLAEGYLAAGHPFDVRDRLVLGRDERLRENDQEKST